MRPLKKDNITDCSRDYKVIANIDARGRIAFNGLMLNMTIGTQKLIKGRSWTVRANIVKN